MEETFKEVDEVIDEFIESGRCSMVTRADNKKQVLFSPVEHLLHPLVCERASDAMRNLWHGDDMLDSKKVGPYRDDLMVPKGRDLEELLLRRKVRTADQLDRRKQRHKAAAERRKAEQDEAAAEADRIDAMPQPPGGVEGFICPECLLGYSDADQLVRLAAAPTVHCVARVFN